MREKLREIRNKEEGFTLVELLAVIVILGIIVAIAVPSIGNVVSNSQKKAEEAEEGLIIDAARIYFTADDEGIKAATNENGTAKEASISVADLAGKGYLEKKNSTLTGTVTRDVKGKYVFVKSTTPPPGD